MHIHVSIIPDPHGHWAHKAAPISVLFALSPTPAAEAARRRTLASSSPDVPVYSLAFAGTH